MPNFKLTTPVVLIIFSKLDTADRVFAEIAKAKPTKLLVISDAARPDKLGEAAKVAATRAIIQRVDWECEVLTHFSDINLGPRNRISSGIDWAFQQVEEAIILEEDCLPGPTFFRFCQELLDRYRCDQRVGMISGCNFQFGHQRNEDSYYFSKYFHIWGMATWRDKWQNNYDVALRKWPAIRDQNRVADLVGNYEESYKWAKKFELTYQNKINTWDYQWVFANWLQGRLCVAPTQNLVSNIGFAHPDAANTVKCCDEANVPITCMAFPLRHPLGVMRDLGADEYEYKRFIRSSLPKRVYYVIRRWCTGR